MNAPDFNDAEDRVLIAALCKHLLDLNARDTAIAVSNGLTADFALAVVEAMGRRYEMTVRAFGSQNGEWTLWFSHVDATQEEYDRSPAALAVSSFARAVVEAAAGALYAAGALPAQALALLDLA